MRLMILGPVVLQVGGQKLALPTRKLQAMLLVLALEGRTRREQLAQWLWPDLPPAAARRNLRRELARLRDAGAGATVQTDGDHLALASGLACDLKQRLADGDGLDWPPLAEGLDDGDGSALGDWLQMQRLQLATQRAGLLGRLADAHEAAQRHPEALVALQQLLGVDPLNEPRLRQRMRLLAAAGRQDEALGAMQSLRQLLREQQGASPAAETEALASSLQRAVAPAGRAPARPPTLEPAGDALPLVGRTQQWQALQQAARQGHCLRIVGEAGIGKTRLACEFAVSLGAYALAQCRRSDAGVPYAAYTRVLRQMAGQALEAAPLPAWVRLELAQLLPELGPAEPRGASAEGQRRFVEACAQAWHLLAAGSFDAVVLDDWHLADDASRSLMHYIIEQQQAVATGDMPLVLFIERAEAVDAADSGGTAAAGWPQLTLSPLDPDAVYQLVRTLSGAPDPRHFANRLLRASGGNPFFLAETLRQWQSLQLLGTGPDGVWQTPFDDATTDYAELPLPDSVRNTVLARMQRQPPSVQLLLQAAALATEPFSAAQLAGACGLSELAALEAVGQAVQAQLLRERDEGFAFEHDLVQAALEEALPPAQRRLVHCRLALGGQTAGLDAAVVARHWESGGQPSRAVVHRIAAAEAAAAVFADEDALVHWQAALDDGPTLAQRVHILGGRGQLLLRRDDQPALQDLLTALDTARDQARALPGASALALQAAVQAAEVLQQAQRNDEALARIQACLADPLLSAGGGNQALAALRAQALRVASRVLSRLGRGEDANAAVRAALDAGGLGPMEQGEMHHALSYSAFLQGDAEGSLVHARRALALWQAAGARHQAAQAQASVGRALDMLDEREAAWAALESAYTQAGTLRMLDLQRVVANNLANNRLHHGGPARAIEVIGESRALSPHFSMAAMPVFYLGILVQAHAQLGRLGEALDLADESLALALALGETLTLADCVGMSLDLMTQLDHPVGQQRLLAALADRPLDGLRYFQVKLCFPLAAHALRTGDCAAARHHLAVLGDVDALPLPPDRAWGRLRLAQLALAEGRPADALHCLQPLDGQPLYTDVQAQSCATRLAAELELGVPTPQALALADEALQADAAGRVLPSLSRLGLLQVRHDAALRLDDARGAASLAAEVAAWQQRLATSLGRHAALAGALTDQRPARG